MGISKKVKIKLENYPENLNILVVVCFTLCIASNVSAQVSSSNITSGSQLQRREQLDSDVGLALEWSINRESNIITLQVEIQPGTGNFALGLTSKGNIEGADVIYFEVNDGNDSPTLVSDMYGVDNSTIIQDARQDWQLISSSSSEDRLLIQIQRNLDTCDDQDMKITESLIQVVWDYGENSTLPSNFEVKGIRRIYFTDTRVYSNSNVQDLQQGRISRRFLIPPRHTTYWCSIHKLNPTLITKHHIVGFSGYFRDEESQKHVHHQLMYRCSAPPGIDPALIFEPFLNHPGEECYLKDVTQLPATLCREFVSTWTIGAPPVVLPDTMGIPIGGSPNEYFMFESHYDNPEMRSDLEVENGMNFEYTPHLRRDEGSLIFTGYGIVGIFAIPPESPSFDIVGHCSSKCITEMVPLGAEVHGVALHAHPTARRMRVKQIRGNEEMPWIQNDDNYDYSYQPMRMLPEPVTLLPGDHLTIRCNYDNTGRNNSVTSSGFSTRDEMCTAFLLINKKLPYLFCSSEYPTEKLMSKFGIQNMTWEVERNERIVTSAVNPSHEGLTMGEVVGNWSSWTPDERDEWQRELMYGTHNANCANVRLFGSIAYNILQLQEATGGLISVPILEEANPTRQSMSTPIPSIPVNYPIDATTFVPPNVCQNPNLESSTSGNPINTGTGGLGIPNIPGVPSTGINTLLTNPKESLTRRSYLAPQILSIFLNGKKLLNFTIMKVHLDCSYLVLVVFILVKNSAKVFTQSTSNALVSQFQRREILDSNIGLALEWSVNRDSNIITLQVEIQHGIPNFALGLTRKGNIEGADVMYFELDPENGNTTPIVSESLIQVVWDYGENSTLPSNFEVRGMKRIYFTDTNVYSNSNLQDLQQGRISRRLRIPPRHTSYWCSIHKLNVSLSTKHHIVGVSEFLITLNL
ncbi:unnamed protein product [Orchesella dallaii]|uniref:DOMON domain-containing protein n=1 Tax=Orchesella dallaii TaxID=48710 RepID=A0ABP1PJH6_9HEXA